MKTVKGFTLVEILITLVIVSVLTAIALPSFRQYVLKSHRLEATTNLTQIQMAQEKYRNNNTNYAGTLNSLNTGILTTNYYNLSLSLTGQDAYTLTATAYGNQTQDTTCSTITITQTLTGVSYTPTACWAH